MSKFLTDRVRKIAPDRVSADRYKFIKLAEVEPDLGVPDANGSFFISGTDGVRAWTDKLNTAANGIIVNGELAASSLDVSGLAELGNIGNVKISGGNTGQVVSTDGAGNLTFVDQEVGVDGGQTPTLIPEGETFTVVENRQAFFQLPITIDGDLVVDGVLIELPSGETTDDLIEGNTNLFFTEERFNTALSLYDGNIDTTGNITVSTLSAGTIQIQGQIESEINTLSASGTLTIDLSSARLASTEQLTGDIVFSTTNVSSGREVTIRVVNGSTTRNLSFPADWTFVGEKPSDVVANKTGILVITSFGTSNSDIIAKWLVEE
jgi:hypothetical protein